MKFSLLVKIVFVMLFAVSITYAQEPVGGPYTVDANTRLLLHFDNSFNNESTQSGTAVPHGKYYFIPNAALGLGQCLRLDNGSITDSSYVTVPDVDALDLTGDWTIEGWLNIFTFGDVAGEWRWVPRLIIKPGDDVFWHPNYWVEMWGDNRLFHTGYYCKSSDGFISNTSANNVFEPGKWTHLTFIRDTKNHLIIQMVHNDKKELIDFQARGYDPALSDPPNTTAQDVHIGWAGSKKIAEPSNDSWLDGFVDEIRISDVVRNFTIPPAITDVTVLPNQPSTVTSYEIQAKVLKIGAAGTITEAKLHYNLGAGWLELPMTAAGNNFYKASMPGQPLGSIIRYYVSAKDNSGYRTTNPATAEAPVNPSYFTFAVFEANTQTLALGFEEGSGVPRDASAYKNPVTVVGKPTYSSEAAVGSKAMYFPGDTTRLDVDSPFLSSSEFTLDFWMRPDTLVEYTRMIIRPLTWDNWGAMNYAIRFESNTGQISARFEQQAGGNNAIVLDSLVQVGRWYHVIYEVAKDTSVFQLSDKTGRVIDKKGNKVVSPPITPMAPLRIGNAHNISVAGWEKRTFKGLIDDFKLYNYPAAGLTKPPLPPEPIGGPYSLDDNTRLLLHFDNNFNNESTQSGTAVPHGKYYFIPNAALGLGQCLRLDNGSITDSSYVTVPDVDALDLTGDWTIEGWLNIFTFGDVAGEWRWVPRLIIKPGDDVFWHPNYWVEMWGDSRVFHTGYYCPLSDGFISNTSANNVFEPGKWAHLTFIRDTKNHLIIQMVHNDKKELIDFQARGYDPALSDPPNTTAQDVHIGWAGSKKIAEPSNDSWLDGFVDEIRISDVVRNFVIPPAITDVTSLPNQSSTVTAYEIKAKALKIGAAGTITEVKLHYNVGSGWLELPMTAMGDNFYQASMPGQPLGSIIRYYVSAKDNSGYRTTNPATAEAAVNPAYFTFAVFQANTQTLALGFEEGAGVPKDASAYKNPVTVRGTPTYSSEAAVGSKSLYFPGDSTRLDIDSPFLSSAEFTLDFWMKPDTIVEYSRIIIRPLAYDNWGAMNYAIRYESNAGQISARFEQQAGGNNAIILDSLVQVGRWYHVIYEVSQDTSVFQLSDKTGRIINKKGNKVVSPPITPLAPLRIGNAHNITVTGQTPPWEKRTFKGLMDDIKLYNYPAAGLTVGVKEKNGIELPKDYALGQNYPNPFNPTTEIIFSVPKLAKVTVAIYDLLGRKVKTLVDRQVAPGRYSITWNGTDEFGNQVASGIYLYRLESNNFNKVRKMLLIK